MSQRVGDAQFFLLFNPNLACVLIKLKPPLKISRSATVVHMPRVLISRKMFIRQNNAAVQLITQHYHLCNQSSYHEKHRELILNVAVEIELEH